MSLFVALKQERSRHGVELFIVHGHVAQRNHCHIQGAHCHLLGKSRLITQFPGRINLNL